MATSSKTPTIKETEKRLDVLTQTVQRCEGMRQVNGVWVSTCVTCGRVLPCFGKNCMQGAHAIPRGCRITRWLPEVVHPGCPRCNGFLNGNYLEYSRYMIRRYGLDKWEQLMDLFDQHKKGTAPKLTVIEKYALYNYWLKKGRELEEKTSLKLFPKSWDYVNIK